MIQLGSRVRIIGVPPNNYRNWEIPLNYVGLVGVVIEMTNRRISIQLIDNDHIDERWSFPPEYDGVLALDVVNRWNPMGYVPMSEPLNLP